MNIDPQAEESECILILHFCKIGGKDAKENDYKGKAKGMRGGPRKPHKGIKIEVSTQGYFPAGAGSMLKRLCSSKVVGKARDRVESSPVDNRGGRKTSNEHISMEDVVSTGVVRSSSLDGITNNKVEEMALNMEYVPNSVCKLKMGIWRLVFSAKEVYKGGQACSLQLYGYFVGISMDYRVVETNMMRMLRVYDIEDITKTSAGVYYLKFKSKEDDDGDVESDVNGIAADMKPEFEVCVEDNLIVNAADSEIVSSGI
nr:hypothetical protein CTI12_AA196540 [Tanacetum cinerariifolium]